MIEQETRHWMERIVGRMAQIEQRMTALEEVLFCTTAEAHHHRLPTHEITPNHETDEMTP